MLGVLFACAAGLGPLKGKVSLQLRDQTSVSNPVNDATLELQRSFSMGADKVSALKLKYTPCFDRDARDKIDLTASAAVRPSEDVVLSAEASLRQPGNAFDVKAALKAKGYLLSMEKNSRDASPLSLLEASTQLLVLGKPCGLTAGVRMAPEMSLIGKAELSVHPRLKLTPIVACRASDLKPSVAKLEASGISQSGHVGWKADVMPALNLASVEVREAVHGGNGLWTAKATVPTNGALGASSVALKREFVW
ncbi:hypothetical protein KFE25_000099 [Diacronema lutheri]|uniref:Uncharacterized protein n=2 Tax=Diacronema lutheri TaxID=2081491 RepID=A0A8J5X918_DIALT|nr:hypothetical protein KFE25_000099 [Diacronema lutheri]